MRKLIFCAALLLAGCGNSPALEATERYWIVNRYGTKAELCEAAKAVRDAYLEERNDTEYLYWSVNVASDCSPYATG